MRGTVGTKENPNLWWRSNQTLFPLLAKYWMANSSFPATSTSAERSFSMDGLILIPTRYTYHLHSNPRYLIQD